MVNFFDMYELRTRWCAMLIALSPIIFTMFVSVKELQRLSNIILFSICLMATMSFLSIYVRKKANIVMDEILLPISPTEKMLFQDNDIIDKTTQERYHRIIMQKSKIKLDNTEQSQKSAVKWLKSNCNKSQRCKLVNQENILFGLTCSLIGIKRLGVFISSGSIVISIILYICSIISLTIGSTLVLIGILYIILWLGLVKIDIAKYAGNKYAIALLSCIDSLE
ncbi:MAG: hypothetical protein ACI4S3_06640 [Candidatus Gastranaerophilaceae bacterium]